MAFLDFIPTITKIIDKLIPDPQAKQQAQLELAKMAATQEGQQLDAELRQSLAAADIIKAEAQSQSWLTCNWRPLASLTFVALIVARWLGWTAPNLQPAEYLELWAVVKVCIGGYTVGRSVEQTAKALAPAIAGVLKK